MATQSLVQAAANTGARVLIECWRRRTWNMALLHVIETTAHHAGWLDSSKYLFEEVLVDL
jgi:hypothetical protein